LSHRVPIHIQLEQFEGPLDLLLHLIQSHELDVSRVSISKITDQYLAYIRLMHELNFDTASDFLLMAATLLLWKSRSLLPRDEEEAQATEEDEHLPTPEDLIRQLLEHQRFLAAGEELNSRPKLGEDTFTRPSMKPPTHKIWRELKLTDLVLGYQESLIRARKTRTVLRKETVSITGKIKEISSKMEAGQMIEMDRFIADRENIDEVIVTFLASLELARMKKLRMHQQQTYGAILIELIEKISDLEIHLADAFSPAELSPEKNQKTRVAAEAPLQP